MSFSDFNLKKEFISSIEAAGYQSPTPLQSQLIPLVAEKKSALVWTQSASGKTGAFLIPAINYILENPAPEKRGARILILTSRRDRVSQINYTIKRLSSEHTMRFGFIVSGRPYQTQMRLMRRPLDIMIATPGRLNDLMNNGKADFSQLEMLITDDLTSIYQKNLHGLIEKILLQAGDCSTLTFVRDDAIVTPYAKSLFSEAIQINVNGKDNNDSNEQSHAAKTDHKSPRSKDPKPQNIDYSKLMPLAVHIADDYTHKIAMMDHLLDEFAGEPTIIYTSTNKAANTLLENLANHGHAAKLISKLEPDEIDSCDILIISDQEKVNLPEDVIAKNDTHIIHFDLPRRTDKFIERLGKHSQDRDEQAIIMVDGYNYNELKHIEKTIGANIQQVTVPGLEPLNPFINQSKSKPARKPNSNSRPQQKNSKQKRNINKNKNTNKNKPRSQNKANNSNSNSTDNKQRRQRKGPFGRLNGGANRKKTKIGVSSRGTSAPANSRSWQSDFAEPKERKAESKTVTIRYSKKRTLLNDKPEEI